MVHAIRRWGSRVLQTLDPEDLEQRGFDDDKILCFPASECEAKSMRYCCRRQKFSICLHDCQLSGSCFPTRFLTGSLHHAMHAMTFPQTVSLQRKGMRATKTEESVSRVSGRIHVTWMRSSCAKLHGQLSVIVSRASQACCLSSTSCRSRLKHPLP